MGKEIIYKGVNINTTPNEASLVNYTDNNGLGATTVQSAIDATNDLISSLSTIESADTELDGFKCYKVGNVVMLTGSATLTFTANTWTSNYTLPYKPIDNMFGMFVIKNSSNYVESQLFSSGYFRFETITSGSISFRGTVVYLTND